MLSYRTFLLITLLGLSVSTAHSANITNLIKGVGPSNASINPTFCIQEGDKFSYALTYGTTANGNFYSGNPYYVGGSLRFGGCKPEDTYLGYVGFSVNESHQNKFSSYSPPEGLHIAYTQPAIDSEGRITGKIQYTPITPNFNLPKVQKPNAIWDFVGINLSGLEFSKVIDPFVIPNLSEEDVNTGKSDLNEIKTFLNAGINTVRVPVSWGFLQLEGAGQGPIYSDYFDSYVKPVLESLTSAGIYTIVDLHAYMRYSTFGKEYSGCFGDSPCPDGKLIESSQPFVDIWAKLFNKIKEDSKINMNYIMLDLVNEPVSVPGKNVFTFQVDAIKKLRSLGFPGYILVEGNAWSGLHSWSTETWSEGGVNYSNASLFSRKNFENAGVDLSKILINVHQYLDSNFSGTHDQCSPDLNTVGPDGFNLNAFVDYLRENRFKAIVTEFGTGKDMGSCQEPLRKFMNYMKDHSAKNKDYGFVGWTIWSTGHGWGDYNLRVKPNSYHMNVLKDYLR